MKKFFSLFICFCSAMILFGCQQNKNIDVTDTARDNLNINIDYSKEIPARQTDTVRVGNGSASTISPIKNDTELFRESSVVVHGKVIHSNYILKGSSVYTKSEVKIISCYKGELKEGEIIKIRESGGFVPSDIYTNAVNMEKFGKRVDTTSEQKIYDIRVENNKVLETGEDVILFLIPISMTDLDEFKNGGYQFPRIWQGKLLFHDDLGVYAPYLPKEELRFVEARSYTLEEFEAFIASQTR